MSDSIESQSSRQLAEAAASPASHDAPAAQPAKEPDLASLLSEFEASTATPKPEPQAPQADPVPATPTPAVDPIAAGMAGFDDLARAHRLEGENKAMSAELQAARHYIDTQHFDQAVTAGEKMLQDAELYVPPDYVRGQLIAMATLNPELAAAFDNRGQAPQAYARMLKKAHNKIYESARAMPDREVTADRMAVANYMRGTTKLPAEQPPNYGDMNEADFAKEKAKYGL